jgi:hypothetical protein
MLEIMLKDISEQETIRELIKEAEQSGMHDNATAVVVGATVLDNAARVRGLRTNASNTPFNFKPLPSSFRTKFKKLSPKAIRMLALCAVIVIGFIVLITFVVNGLIAALTPETPDPPVTTIAGITSAPTTVAATPTTERTIPEGLTTRPTYVFDDPDETNGTDGPQETTETTAPPVTTPPPVVEATTQPPEPPIPVTQPPTDEDPPETTAETDGDIEPPEVPDEPPDDDDETAIVIDITETPPDEPPPDVIDETQPQETEPPEPDVLDVTEEPTIAAEPID